MVCCNSEVCSTEKKMGRDTLERIKGKGINKSLNAFDRLISNLIAKAKMYVRKIRL